VDLLHRIIALQDGQLRMVEIGRKAAINVLELVLGLDAVRFREKAAAGLDGLVAHLVLLVQHDVWPFLASFNVEAVVETRRLPAAARRMQLHRKFIRITGRF